MRPVKFEIIETDENLTSHSGLALIGTLIDKSGLRDLLFDALPAKKKGCRDSREALIAMTGLLCLAKPDFSAIEQFRDNDFFQMALGLSEIPSEPTLRQRCDEIGLSVKSQILNASARLVKKTAPKLTPCFKDFIALDVDVSPFDNSGTKKEGVSCTYKHVDGYAPIFCYIGNEGYLLNAELREGKEHCQNGTPKFLRESIKLVRKITDKPLLVRLDAGNDDIENIRMCNKEKVKCIIKRNIRKESIEDWLVEARALGEWRTPREGKTVYVGETVCDRDGICMRVVFNVIERTIDRNGQILLVPEVEVETWWTTLGKRTATPDDVIALYHAHGTSEQFHSELKSDMDLERLPSGKFATNALILTLGAFAFNLLRLCGQSGMENGYLSHKKKEKRRRLRSVIQDLMYMAARVINHARRLKLALSRCNKFRYIWMETYLVFASG